MRDSDIRRDRTPIRLRALWPVYRCFYGTICLRPYVAHVSNRVADC